MAMTQRPFRIDALALICGFILLAQVLSYMLPQGAFERAPYADNPNRSVVVAGSYAPVTAADAVTLKPWHFLLAISRGLADAADVIFLIFLVGGVIEVIRHSGAIDAALLRAVDRLGHRPGWLIAGCLLMFSVGSFTIGMGEEYLPLVPIIVSMCLAMRMDALVAMGIVWVPYGIGWGCAGINPFSVLIAQGIAGVPLTSGAGARFVLMLLILAVAFHHVLRYARRVQADPSSSLVADVAYGQEFEPPAGLALTRKHIAILGTALAGVALFVWGAATHHWYIGELNAVFLGIGLMAALIARMGVVLTSEVFLAGCAKMTAAALSVGFARTIGIVLEDGQIIDTIIHGIAGVFDGMPASVSAVAMLVVQSVLNFFIPSGSGQAFVTMPIMSPLATLTGVPQQTAVLAFQFGDGFTNMALPTNALLMGALAIGRVPYTAWLRFIGPLLGKILLIAAAFLVISVHWGHLIGLH